MTGLLAGAAEVDLTPPLDFPGGVELMGYGARQGVATTVHDRLHARGLYLGRAGEDRGAGFLLVSAELCLLGARQARELRERLAVSTGIPSQRIQIACTHTHSGPESGLGLEAARGAARGRGSVEGDSDGDERSTVVAGLEAAIVRAGELAASEVTPVSLVRGRGRAAIGRNRRIADGPLDTEVLAFRLDSASGPLAVLFQYACHPTVLGHDNLEVSADWPGTACRVLRERTGAVPIFLLGAHADVDPRTRGLMDLAIPDQSKGLGHTAARVLGLEVADAVSGALDAPEYRSDTPEFGSAHAELRLPVHLGDLAPQDARAELERRKREIAELYGFSPDAMPRLSELYARSAVDLDALPLAEARRRTAIVRRFLRDKTAPFFADGERQPRVELQVLRLGDTVLLGLPAETTTEVGLDWKRRATRRFEAAGVVSIANGWLRYLPHPRDLAHPDADLHYEVLQSLLAPGASERLLDEAESLLGPL